VLSYAIEDVFSSHGVILLKPWFTAFSICVINIPLALRWTKLEVEGPGSVAGLRNYSYDATELAYGLASVAVMLITVAPLIALDNALTWARQNGGGSRLELIEGLMCAVAIVATVVALRLSFCFQKSQSDNIVG
jgi:hypothetical protein